MSTKKSIDPTTLEALRGGKKLWGELDCMKFFYKLCGYSIEELKELIPNGWTDYLGMNYVPIGRDDDCFYGVLYLKKGQYWPRHFHPADEFYLILNGSCTVMLGHDKNDPDSSKIRVQGDYIDIPSDVPHGLNCNIEDVIIAYGFPQMCACDFCKLPYIFEEPEKNEEIHRRNDAINFPTFTKKVMDRVGLFFKEVVASPTNVLGLVALSASVAMSWKRIDFSTVVERIK